MTELAGVARCLRWYFSSMAILRYVLGRLAIEPGLVFLAKHVFFDCLLYVSDVVSELCSNLAVLVPERRAHLGDLAFTLAQMVVFLLGESLLNLQVQNVVPEPNLELLVVNQDFVRD